MQKLIEIDGKQVLLESNASTPLRYKKQFGKDYFAELLKISKTINRSGDSAGGEIQLNTMSYEDLEHLDFEVIYNIVWVLAKTAAPQLPDPITWLDRFESFPMKEVMEEALDLIVHCMQVKKNFPNAMLARSR